jgi:hypothetical protein
MIEADLADDTDFNSLETHGKMLLGYASSDSHLKPSNLNIFISAENQNKPNTFYLFINN